MSADAGRLQQDGPLALICGGGSLPLAVADFVSARGRQVVLFPLHGAAEGTAVERFPHHWIYIGQIGKFMRLARAAGCRDVIFIGALVRPSLWQVHPDLKGLSTLRARPRSLSRRRQSSVVQHGQVARARWLPLAWRA